MLGTKNFRIAEHRHADFMSRFSALVVPVSLVPAQLLEFAGRNVELSSLGH